ncbi:DUF6479 family protein [Streptomyces zhihengii]
MTTHSPPAQGALIDLAAGEGAPAVIVFLLIVVGLLVLLVWIVWQVGARRRRDAAPTRDELPTPPDHRTHVESRLEPDEVDPSQGRQTPGRLTPHEMHGYGNMGARPSAEEPPRPEPGAEGDTGPGHEGSRPGAGPGA